MKIVFAPDSFKGTLTAREVCEIEGKVIRRRYPDAELSFIPMADGGEGLAEAYLSLLGGERIEKKVTGPDGSTVEAYYGILPDGTAVLEMAQASGITLVKNNDPLTATTKGTGELIRDAMERGVKRLILGLGGSATNDCGIGMGKALGFQFLDHSGREVEPLAVNLGSIERIIVPEKEINLTVEASCDVESPLLGPEGATYTYGPQKGADSGMLQVLESGMRHFAEVLERETRIDPDTAGAGAAGGMGAFVLTLLEGSLKPGSELLLTAAGFDEIIADADLVITGEGRIDWQSARGKVVSAVGRRCRRQGISCIAIGGALGQGAEDVLEYGIGRIYGASEDGRSMAEIRAFCREELERITEAAILEFFEADF